VSGDADFVDHASYGASNGSMEADGQSDIPTTLSLLGRNEARGLKAEEEPSSTESRMPY
jgi:hypothetical protein